MYQSSDLYFALYQWGLQIVPHVVNAEFVCLCDIFVCLILSLCHCFRDTLKPGCVNIVATVKAVGEIHK